MKTFFLPLFLLFTSSLFAQILSERIPDGGGEFTFEKTSCLQPEERLAIEARLTASTEQLRQEGRLPQVADRNVVSFAWPLRSTAPGFLNYYGISNYVDQNNAAGVLDYNCGAITYDGHYGTDFFTWPFSWYLMNNNYVEIIAAADGTIIDKQDGNADDHCACSGNWNAVYVQHADGSIAWYGHMKTGSLTSKSIGQSVTQGEYLGVVGSSGCSTGPHLHFEIYKALPYQRSNLIDPYQGACNSLNPQSWWATQASYRQPTLNALLTHSSPPLLNCPTINEATNFSNTFAAGATAYFGTYYRDQTINQVVALRIRKPDNSIWQSWSQTFVNNYNASWWWWSWILPTNGPNGTWKFEVVYLGQTYTHDFTVTGALPVELTQFEAKITAKNTIALTWETANEQDNDFFVIQRSRDGSTFEKIGTVKGNGKSNTSQHYSFPDTRPFPGTNYYRLQQVDFNGAIEYSSIVNVQIPMPRFSVLPNPTTGSILLAGPGETIDQVRIIDPLGKTIRLLKNRAPQDPIDLSDYPSGIYLLEITQDTRIERLKVLKQ